MLNYEALRDDVKARVAFLPDKPEETPDSTLRALWLTAAGRPMSAEASLSLELPQLSDVQAASLAQLIERRASGVPLAHLTQRQRFMDMEMLAGAQALVPRKETELLARAAVQLTRDLDMAHVKVLDVCTGSGNVALAIAYHVPAAYVYAADLSEDAVGLARQNARHIKLTDRIEFRAGDLLQPFDAPQFLGQIDVLTCNPPYINSAKVERMPTEISAHEPRLAFDGGSLGIGILMRLMNEAPRFIRPGGWLAFEVGLGQGPALVKRMKAGVVYKDIATVQDDAGAIRVVMARC